MARVNVDPAELRRFAKDLRRFSQELEQMSSAIHARSNELARSWQDQEQRRFAEEFEQQLKQLSRFVESTEEYSAFLNKKAAHVEAYLNQR